jgi:hypothetical protein
MLQMVQLGEMQHLCSIKGSLLKEGPHLLQMLHRAGAVLRCTFGVLIRKSLVLHDALRCVMCCDSRTDVTH